MKRLSVILCGSLLTAVMAMAQPVLAQDLVGSSYFVVKGGGWSLQEQDIKDSKIGAYVELASGGKFNRFLGMEFGIGYMETEGKFLAADAKAGVIPINLSLRLGIPIAIIEPYIIAGGGLYFTTVRAGSDSTTTVNGGYQAGLGVDLNFESFLIGLEGRYYVIKGDVLGRTIDLDGSTIALKAGIRF